MPTCPVCGEEHPTDVVDDWDGETLTPEEQADHDEYWAGIKARYAAAWAKKPSERPWWRRWIGAR